MNFGKRFFPSEDRTSDDRIKVEHLHLTSAGIDDFIEGMNGLRQGAKKLKQSGAKFVDNETGTESEFPPVGHERISEIIVHNRQVKKIIEERVDAIRKRCSAVLKLPQKSETGRVKIEMQIRANGQHVFTRDFKEVWEQQALMQAESVLLDRLVQEQDIAEIRKFSRNSVISGVLGNNSLIDVVGTSLAAKFPLVFSSGYDYFDRSDLFRIDPK